MRIEYNGNVGIGTAGPQSKLQINSPGSTLGLTGDAALRIAGGTFGTDQIVFGYSESGGYSPAVFGYIATTATAYQYGDLFFATRSVTTNTAPTERMRITSAGRVGIGTSDPATRLHIEAPTQSYGQLRIVSTSGIGGEASMNFGRSDQTIDSRWTVGQGLDGVGNTFAFYSSGNKATLTTAGVWSTTGGGTSDLRTKQDIEYEFDNGIESILKLQPTKFKFKSAPDKQRRGFIAQDVLGVIPDLILGDGELEGGTYGLDYDGILTLAVKAIQELKAENDTLKSRIDTLEQA